MSNYGNFIAGTSVQRNVGEKALLPYNGDHFTSSNGLQWKACNGKPLAYSSVYAALITDAPQCITSAVALNSPFASNLWGNFFIKGIVGSSTWLMMPATTGAAVFPDFYYTSTDSGSTWTKRTPPVAAKSWASLWDGTNYVIYAGNTAATGAQESTDGVSWTARTAINVGTVQDFIFANSLYVVFGNSAFATSADRTTWTTRTPGTLPSWQRIPAGNGMGLITWNAGASLFIMGTNVNGRYQTSPDGTTWTNRSTQLADQAGLADHRFTLFASSGTVTVIAGISGAFAYSTDGLSWTPGFMDTAFASNAVDLTIGNLPGINGGPVATGATNNAAYDGKGPTSLFYDGTRFVANYNGIVYYSTNGSSWTRASYGNVPQATSLGFQNPAAQSLFRTPSGFAVHTGQTVMHQTDVTSVTKTNIIYPVVTDDGVQREYFRIK